MTKGRSDIGQKNRLLTSVCIVALFLVFLYVFCGSKNAGESALEYGSRSLRKLGSSYLSSDEDSDIGGKQDESSMKFGLDDEEDVIYPKSFPASLFTINRIEHKLTFQLCPPTHTQKLLLMEENKD